MKFRGVLVLSLSLVAACEPPDEDDFTPRGTITGPGTGTVDECDDGMSQEQICPLGGVQERWCLGGSWGEWSVCAGDCLTPGEEETESCEDAPGSIHTRVCQLDYYWSEWSACPVTCDEIDRPDVPCGLNGRGSETYSCLEGEWVLDDCTDPDECVDGTSETVDCLGGLQGRSCFDGQWELGECVTDPLGICDNGDTTTESCGLNGRGTRTDVCEFEDWTEGECDDPDLCVDGSQQSQPCGSGGLQPFFCVAGKFEPNGECSQRCGNGTVEGNEECDDTLNPEPNGCSATCETEQVRLLHSAGHCDRGPIMLAASYYGAAHWLSSCTEASLYSRSDGGAVVSTGWEYSASPASLSLSTSADGSSPILWGTYGAGIPWSVFGQGDAFNFVLELDARHQQSKGYTFSGDANQLLALQSFGTGRFSLVGNTRNGGAVVYQNLALNSPRSTFTPQTSLFVVEQKPQAASGFTVSSSKALESTKFAAQAGATALLVRNAGGAFELSSGAIQASQLLVVSNVQGRFVATPGLKAGAQSVALLASGNAVVTGTGGGDYDVQGKIVSLPAGPVTLVYDNKAGLTAAHVGRFLAETEQGTLAVLGDFTGAEVTLDAGLLSERKLSSPYGQYNRYLAFYRLSGAVADARVVASSANQSELTVDLEPRAFSRGFVLSTPCSSATLFGDAAGSASAGDGLCMARFDGNAQLGWSRQLGVQPGSTLLVGVDKDHTWLGGALTSINGQQRANQVAVVSLTAWGSIYSDDPIVAVGAGRLKGMVANGKRALVVATFNGTPEVFPGRPWSTSEWSAGNDYLIQVQP